ncbi:hypothetical protein J6590_014403 [Homalodisca vitripennis]|nr:hypothetical protein J6590_014403 [Homalodisca vitripennis]
MLNGVKRPIVLNVFQAQSSMKCPRKSSMPSGIQHWLEEQLEARGFDATIYSKYILSVLCNSSSDLPIKPKARNSFQLV